LSIVRACAGLTRHEAKPETRNQKLQTRNQKPETRNYKPETRNQKPERHRSADVFRLNIDDWASPSAAVLVSSFLVSSFQLLVSVPDAVLVSGFWFLVSSFWFPSRRMADNGQRLQSP
jgi:hypothetical protein